MSGDGPLIVQSDRTVLLEVAHPDADDARHDLATFAELERAPEHIHTYRITRPRALERPRRRSHGRGDARRRSSAGRGSRCRRVSPSTSPRPSAATAGSVIERDLGRRAHPHGAGRGACCGRSREPRRSPACCSRSAASRAYVVQAWARGELKQELLKLGWPAEDLAGYTPGTPHDIDLDTTQLAPAAVPGGCGGQLPQARFRRRGAALRRGQDPGRARPRWPRWTRPPSSW